MKKHPWMMAGMAGTAALLGSLPAHAFVFSTEDLRGSFDSTISMGGGMRAQSRDSTLISPIYDFSGATPVQTGGGTMGQFPGINDQGDLNYNKGRFFTGYLKGGHELLLNMPSAGLSFLARVSWLRDFAATQTSGLQSGQPAVAGFAPAVDTNGLSSDASKDLRYKARLLDLWVSKTFDVAGKQLRVRAGNQVISWGESLYEGGGINQTNAYDVNRLSQPGTQLKEAVLPAPILSVAAGLGHGLNVEGYLQARWNANYLPPVGGYWSTATVGVGAEAYHTTTARARKTGQWGLSLRYQPAGTQLNLGVYAMNYHDKSPQNSIDLAASTATALVAGPLKYAEDRRMYGISANFPVGDWAIGTELSYRPKDAVSLNAASGCVAQGGDCWVDQKRYQWHITTLYTLQPSNAGGLLKLLGADTAQLISETVLIKYPTMKSEYGGSPVAAGGWIWGYEYYDALNPAAAPRSASVGSKSSGGINLDFSWTYDGSLIKGWQVTPEIYYRRGLFGRTPNVTAQFMKGVSSVNFIVNFVQNPANWQFAFNYAKFTGGKSPLDNPLRDRDFFGFVVSRNF